SIGFSNTQAVYDNVVITSVPEPEGYLLMALGLAGVGFIARRRTAA
ncbi:MAG: PEP-CTERM sorting domain-containing protein, partial [Bacteriovorax sp.]|nr:PEP-CTERM sorting domain-containing protein [Rhizobacter sp.]